MVCSNNLSIIRRHVGQRGIAVIGPMTVIRYKNIRSHEHVVSDNDALMRRDMNSIVYLAVLTDNKRGAIASKVETTRITTGETLPINEATLATAKVKGTANKSRTRE